MTIYIVPKEELFRFASSLKKPIVRDINHQHEDAVFCIENLTEPILKDVLNYTLVGHVSRDIVTNDYSEKIISYPQIKVKCIFGTEYVKYWCNYFNVTAYPSVINRISFQCDLIGYDSFYQLLLRSYYLSKNDPIKHRLASIPTFFNLFVAISTGNLSEMMSNYNKIFKFYSSYTIYNTIIIFTERIIDYLEYKPSIESFPENYKNIIRLAAKNLSLTSICDALKFLGFDKLTLNSRILLFFKLLSNKPLKNKKHINGYS